jgi:ABC-2 type transport system ATP-binding protein
MVRKRIPVKETRKMTPKDNDGQAIAVSGLAKRFDDRRVVRLLGPNGAGKTTTINMLTGLARPDAGTVRIGGIDCTKNPKARPAPDRGGAGREQSLPGAQRFRQPVLLRRPLRPAQRAERRTRAGELLERLRPGRGGRPPFGGYSKGMKRKLTIAAGIIHSPEILFLDEPTTGIDVASARQVREIIADLHRGTTIFLTTHYIEEAERLCQPHRLRR